MSFGEVFRDRYYESGYVYIAGSQNGRVLKIGTCLKAWKQSQYLRHKHYGGLTDWTVLYYTKVENRGMVEHDARRDLPRVVRYYEKDGRQQRGREIVSCDFTDAFNALNECLTEEQRANAWKSPRCHEFDFDAREKEERMLAAEALAAAQTVSFRSIFLKKVSELQLSMHSANCLRSENIIYIGDLVQKTEAELLRATWMGRKSLNEIKMVLAQLDLSLGVSGITGWPAANAEALEAFLGTPFLISVDALELTVRSFNCLKAAGLLFVGDVVQRTEADMLRMPNFGRKSLNEVKEVLVQIGLHLGMEVPGWPPPHR